MSKESMRRTLIQAFLQLERGLDYQNTTERIPEPYFDFDYVRSAYNIIAKELGLPKMDMRGHTEPMEQGEDDE